MIDFVKRWVKGEYGLAKTYWLFGFLGGLVMSGIVLVTTALATNLYLVTNPPIYNLIIYGFSWLAILYSIGACIAIINASAFERKRGTWGWIATVLSVIALARIAVVALKLSGAMPYNFQDFSDGLLAENSGLPVRVDEVTVLNRIDTRFSDKSILYYYKLDTQIENEEYFKKTIRAQIMDKNCKVLVEMLDGGAKRFEYIYTDPNINKVNVIINASEC